MDLVEQHRADVLVVIPLYKHSMLVAEAIDSCLRQEGGVSVRILVVNDGCPFPETTEILSAFSARFPDRFVAIRQTNSGLSAARNAAIELGLRVWSDWRALYFLDADNRIERTFLKKALSALERSPETVGFAYPDVDMFGFQSCYDTSGPFSKLMLLTENYVEAGSLVSRRMLEAGIRFDESMKLGFEDWDFWLCAIDGGWTGVHVPAAGFKYRRRGESMLTESERRRGEILSQLRQKHTAKLLPRELLKLEHEEAPRFLFFDANDRNSRSWGTDPARLSRVPPSNVPAWLARMSQVQIPPFFVFAARTSLDAFNQARILKGLLTSAEQALESCDFAVFSIDEPQTRGRVSISVSEEIEDVAKTSMLVIRSELMRSMINDTSDDWIRSLLRDAEGPKVRHFKVGMNTPSDADPPISAMQAAVLEIEQMKSACQHLPDPAQPWRNNARQPHSQSAHTVRELAQTGPLYPIVGEASETHIGFLVPFCEFGGVEKVVQNYAKVFRQLGCHCHLFVCGTQRYAMDKSFHAEFESIALLTDFDFSEWSDSQVYFGAGSTRMLCEGSNQRRLLGWFGAMDIVVNAHVADAHGVMAALRRAGTKTICSQHLMEKDRWSRPIGNYNLAAAFEHAYDYFAVISNDMRSVGLSLGIPAAKLILVPNAPSFPSSSEAIGAALRRKEKRVLDGSPIRCLYLGRLDWQKGADHLDAIVRATSGDGFHWRSVGKPVIDDDPWSIGNLIETIEPPVYSARELEELYDWADVVVLPSRFEGVPLTILEAQRAGCIVVATNVGAVSEVVCDRVDGILVPLGAGLNVPEEFVRELRALHKDAQLRLSILRAAAAAGKKHEWQQNLFALLGELQIG